MSLKKFFDQFEETEDDKSEFASRGNYNENLSKEQAGLKQTEMKEAWDEEQEISEGGSSKRPKIHRDISWNKCVQEAKRR